MAKALPSLLLVLYVSATGAAGQTVIANSQLQTCIASGSVSADERYSAR